MAQSRVVIVGAGQAGHQVAASLRQGGFDGSVLLLGDEPCLPYQRPPLSKAYLKGGMGLENLLLRPVAFYRTNDIDWLGGERAAGIDRAARQLALATGGVVAYDHLVLATGTRNRPLPVPGADLDGVLYLRTVAEASLLRERLGAARQVVVVGAGFIGLEFAAMAAEKGVQVTVVEALERPMARALSREASQFFAAHHRGMGTRLVFGAGVTRILGAGGRAEAVQLADGSTLPAEIVLVCIGVLPNTDLAATAGLAVANGIVVDEHLSTADPAISAIGDCAVYPSRHCGGMARLESVQNAIDQGKAVAERLLGRDKPYGAVPWFWSDQGDRKLQMVGLTTGHDRCVVRGDPETGRFSVFCYSGERLLGIESVNRPADHILGRRLLAGGPTTRLRPAEAGDESFDLKGLVAAAP
jgi:3-phenylpropionate/trans-cinnamate dioxygenase ferredoxin reductase subunit